MISILHLLWIVPVAASIGFVLCSIMVAARSGDVSRPKASNTDRIQTATTEDLTDEIHAISLGYKPWCDYHCENQGDDGCEHCIQAWLQQPAQED